MGNRTFILADGENLVLRYQASLTDGAQKTDGTVYVPNVLVWRPEITTYTPMNIIRVSYYTTIVGDELKIEETKKKIADICFNFTIGRNEWQGSGRLCPHVFKKENKSQKTKSVDINITIDALRHTYNDSLDTLFLLSGDGDYIPLIQEVMRQGKRVVVGAFSNGLNQTLLHIADGFLNLDPLMLKK